MHNFAKMRQLKLLKKEPPVLTSFQNKLQLFRKQKFKLSTNNITSFMSSNKHHKILLLHNEINNHDVRNSFLQFRSESTNGFNWQRQKLKYIHGQRIRQNTYLRKFDFTTKFNTSYQLPEIVLIKHFQFQQMTKPDFSVTHFLQCHMAAFILMTPCSSFAAAPHLLRQTLVFSRHLLLQSFNFPKCS